MTYNPDRHHKFSIRKENHDYALSGFYFITICTRNRENIFGEIVQNIMQLNTVGEIVQNEWLKTQQLRNNVILDEFIVMPNHVHLLFKITEMSGDNQNMSVHQRIDNVDHRIGSANPYGKISLIPFKIQSQNVISIIRGFKSATTKNVSAYLQQEPVTIWQSRFYDVIITSDEHLEATRLYIKQNPENWEKDGLNVINK